MIALFISIYCMPFFLCFVFYLIALSQQHILSWHGFTTTLWAGPYFAVGGIVCVIACGLSLYWMRTDKKSYCDQNALLSSPSDRITNTVTIDDARWAKFQALGGCAWLDTAIDEA